MKSVKMKRVLILLAVQFICHLLHAQDNTNDLAKGKLELGIEGGPNTAYISGWTSFIGWRTGLCAGITGQYNINGMFSLKSGIMYEQKGDRLWQESSDTSGKSTTIILEDKLNYLVVPVFAKVAFGHSLKFFVEAGPWFGYLLDATYTSSITNSGSATMNSSRNEISDFHQADMGVSAGAGLEMPIKSKFVIDLELRYNQGLLNADNHTSAYPQALPLPVLTNESIDLLLELRYRL